MTREKLDPYRKTVVLYGDWLAMAWSGSRRSSGLPHFDASKHVGRNPVRKRRHRGAKGILTFGSWTS